jgi:hypothetical protein
MARTQLAKACATMTVRVPGEGRFKALSIVTPLPWLCLACVGHAGRLTAQNDGFRPGQEGGGQLGALQQLAQTAC